MVARRTGSDSDREPSPADPGGAAAGGSSKVDETARLLDELRETGGQILTSSAHGIRNHITIIQSYLEIIHSDLTAGLSDDQLSFLGIAYDHVLRLRNLIDDLVLLGAIETGIADLNPIAVDFGRAATRITTEKHDAAQHRKVTVRCEVEGEPAIGVIDKESLVDLIDRLLDNSLKFTPEGGAIVVRVFRESEWAVISVSDSGVGIPAEHLIDVFELFTQFHRESGEPRESHGLGLPIVKRLVEAHGGQIRLESTVGGGTEITVRIPAV